MKISGFLMVLLLAMNPMCCLVYGAIDSTLVDGYQQKGEQLFKERRYDSSAHYHHRALQIYRGMDDTLGMAQNHYGVGIAIHLQRNFDSAYHHYIIAESLLGDALAQPTEFSGKLNNALGSIMIDRGYRLEAKRYLENALSINTLVHGVDHYRVATNHYNLGLVAMYFGEYKTSLGHFMKAYPIYLSEYGENGSRVAQLYTNIGILHRENGDYEQAIEYLERAIAIHLENHDKNYWNLAYPYGALGNVYQFMNDDDRAREYYLEVLRLCELHPNDLYRVESIYNNTMGILYHRQGDYEKSRLLAQKGIDLLKARYHDQHPRLGEYYKLMGDNAVRQGNMEEAQVWYDEAIDIIESAYGPVHPNLASIYLGQATFLTAQLQYQLALEKVEKAMDALSDEFSATDLTENPLAASVLDERMYLSLLQQKVVILYEMGTQARIEVNELEKALVQAMEASSVIDHIRRGYLSENSKLFLQENVSSFYETALDICYLLHQQTSQQQYLEHALFFMEKSKSAVLTEALQESSFRSVKGVPDEIIKAEKDQKAYVKWVQLKLANAQLQDEDDAYQELKRLLFTARHQLDSLADVIKTNYPHYYDLKYDLGVVTLGELQTSIGANTMLLTLFDGAHDHYLYTISLQGVEFSKIGNDIFSNAEFEELVGLIRAPVSDKEKLKSLASKFYRVFLQSHLDQQDSINRLIFAPGGRFGYLPFEALVVDDNYLLQRFSISYANSLTLRSRNKSFVFTGDEQRYSGFAPTYADNQEELPELRGARNEVLYAAELFTGAAYIDEMATEYQFKQLEQSPAILHLAMHALIDDQSPMNSRFAFYSNNDSIEDGDLNAYEIYNLNLNTDLAILSACNTGLGRINRGEGIMSLSRAFRYAGCPNIMMSLWKARDEPSTEIVTAFLTNLADGMDKDLALQKAKIDFLAKADPLQAHPANWATFVIIGDTRPIQFGRPYRSIWSLLLGIGLLGVLGLMIWKRKKI